MRLLILGTGSMAHNHALQFGAIDGVKLVAAVDIDAMRLQQFCQAYGISQSFSSLTDAVKWGQFDAVTNATPDKFHCPTTLEAMSAHKHVFCEKPLATNYPDAMKMVQAAHDSGKVGMVNLSYRSIPELCAARAIISNGEIGSIRHVEASYLQSWLVSKKWGDWRSDPAWLWRLSTKHGSNGVLGDVGVHILDFVTFGTNTAISDITCRLKTFEKTSGNQIEDYELDANDSFVMTASFSNGALGVIHASRWATGHINELKLRVYGDKGGLELRHWHEGTSLIVCKGNDTDDGIWRPVHALPVPNTYKQFADAVKTDIQLGPSFDQAARIQKILDLAVNSI